MHNWRRLRDDQPDLFRGLLVWQSPTAFVDQVIFGWQQELEGRESAQTLRLVDCFSGAWSQTGAEMSWLMQQLQASVAPGCTAISQVTDTAFAAGAKAAAGTAEQTLTKLTR